MGMEIEVNSLEEMCDLMCSNKLPKKKNNKKEAQGNLVVFDDYREETGEQMVFIDLLDAIEDGENGEN